MTRWSNGKADARQWVSSWNNWAIESAQHRRQNSTDAQSLFANRQSQIDKKIASAEALVQYVDAIMTGRDRTLSAAEDEIKESYLRVTGQTFTDFNTTQANHTSADFGLLYAPGIDSVVPYFGANFYFSPVNRDVPLEILDQYRLRRLHRLSLTVGITLSSIAKPKQRIGISGDNGLLLGAGWRMTDALRLSGGVLIFKEADPNPLVDDESVTVSPYIGFSWDVSLKKTFEGFGGLFGP